jgi:outer membrane protein
MKRGLAFCILLITACLAVPAMPITLKESVDMALSSNPQVLSAQKKLNASEARLGQARSYLLPSLSVAGSVGKMYQEPSVINVPGVGTFSTAPDSQNDISTYSFTLSQMIYNGGAINGMAIAYYAYSSAKEEVRNAMLDAAYNVASAYYALINAKKAHDISADMVDSLRRYVEQVNVLYNSDLVTKADVLRVQTQLENAKQQEILARKDERLARLSLNSVIGIPLTEETTPVIDEKEVSMESLSLSSLLDKAYKQRPDWLSYKLAEQTADAMVSVSYSGYMPNFALVGSYGKTIINYEDKADQDYNSNLLSWRALITGSWTLFDGMDTPNKVAESQANLDALRADGKTLSDAIALDVTSDYYELLSSYDRVAAARTAEDMARKMMRFAELNFSQRIYTSVQLLDSQNAYHVAQLDLLSAIYDMELAKAKLNKAVGQDIYRNNLFAFPLKL